ncbi:sulfite exporter TauE/SafE family protein [Pseudoalteromonas sp. SCSIO 43101]|nr:sulfite exporter TauE/SafE family protein [Pseudoalteromonas sp. HF66]RZD23618.1 sulfite exporter TauE/SafE family protein [Pseudoalteromonas sp. MEBiC 03485]URQ92008.1 sulfite exporter TauE/SafE family protein [Pseudoalteromonas sp. SCSIO 43101]
MLAVIKSFSWLRTVPWLFIIAVYCTLLLLQGPANAVSNFVTQLSIAATMAVGSFVAGGTALGGGAVAFPVMTKILAIEPATAKVFSLAIQSFGMTAAALTIIFSRIPYYKQVVLIATPMAIFGAILSLFFIADHLPRLAVKAVFSALLLCFALTLAWRIYRRAQHICSQTKITVNKTRVALIATLGGVASGLVGSGADIAVFALLVIAYNANIQRATATTVIIMAVTSVVASVMNYFYLETINPQIQAYLLAAIPVVVLGAPLGAYVCARVKSGQLISFLLLLIALEVSFTIYELLIVI